MSFSIEPKILKKLVDFYHPHNKGEEMKYMIFMKGEDEMYMNLQTSPFQGISENSIQQRTAWFGQNKITNPFQFTLFDALIKSLTQYTCMVWLFVFSLILFIIGLFFKYNSLHYSYMQGLIGMVIYLINSFLIFLIEFGKYQDFKSIYNYKSDSVQCDVWRQNKREKIDSQFVVVGDIVELYTGSVIPADGWIIEGELKVEEQYSYGKIQTNKTTIKGCVNHFQKLKKTKTRKYTIVNKLKSNRTAQSYSPVVIGGSVVIEGQGRMLVLCVGKYSRRGQFELLFKNINPQKNFCPFEKKMQEYSSEIFKYGFVSVIALIFGFFMRVVVTDIITKNLKISELFLFKNFQFITLSLNFLLYLIPQGCLSGLALGLLIHKKRLEFGHQINVKQLINCESMSYVEYICHQKQTLKSYFKIREWWNTSGINEVDKQVLGQIQNGVTHSNDLTEQQRLFKNLKEVHPMYLNFFRKAMTVTGQTKDLKNQSNEKSLKYGSFRNLDQCFINYSKRKSYIDFNEVNQDQIIDQIPYDNIRKRTVIITSCPEDIKVTIPNSSTKIWVDRNTEQKQQIQSKNSLKLLPKSGSHKRIQRKVIIYVRGKHQTVLQICDFVMCKQTAKIQSITEEKALRIKATIESMLRRQLRAVALAYKITTKANTDWDDNSGFVLIAIIGINDTRSTQDFQLFTKIKQLNINLMISSTNSMEASISAANEIGIIKADESSIIINGLDFMHILGGIICSVCKKQICACEHGNDSHKVKNIDEFQRILKHLDVLADAEAFHKYTLVVGLKNKNICSAVTGKKLIDVPSMLHSEVSLFSFDDKSESMNSETKQLYKSAFSIGIPDNSMVTLFNLIKQSRICHKFIRKFLRLSTCFCIVSIVYLLTNLILFKQDFGLKLIHVFWIQTVIMFFMALALGFDNESDDNDAFPIMNENIKNYNKDEPLINSEGWRQIAVYSLTQLIIIFMITFLGPLFIPQKADDIDNLINEDWRAKYESSSRLKICSGLPYPFQGLNWHYNEAFDRYGIYSRHQTIIFAIFSVMQILNYFNFRQYNMKEVNIFKNFKLVSILAIFSAIFINILFIQKAGEYAGLYTNGLIFEQWIICFGVSMVLWVVGIIGRLFPNLKKQGAFYEQRWQNKAYNLAVKSVAFQNELSDFQVDDEFDLKPDIFSSRKIR